MRQFSKTQIKNTLTQNKRLVSAVTNLSQKTNGSAQVPVGQQRDAVRSFHASPSNFQTVSKNPELTAILCSAAASGSVSDIQGVMEKHPNINLNEANEDKRTPLHLAASEGNLEIVRFLVENGADVNMEDRWNSTPLHDSIQAKQIDVFNYLLSRGGKTSMTEEEKVSALNSAARSGDLDQVRTLVKMGVDVNKGDYDNRTALHLSCDSGSEEVVEFLIENGADINAIDNFGRTPVQDAIQNKHDDLVQFLFTQGAMLPSFVQDVIRSPELASSLQKSLPILCEREGFEFCEVFVPARNNKAIKRYKVSHTAKDRNSVKVSHLVSYQKGNGLAGRVWDSKEAMFTDEITKENFSNFDQLKKAGVIGAMGVPIMTNAHKPEVFAVLVFYQFADQKYPCEIMDQPENALSFVNFANGLIIAGIETLPNRRPTAQGSQKQMDEVIDILENKGVFDPTLAYYEVDRFFNYMGISDVYFKHFTNEEIAEHIHSLMAAKKVAETSSGNPDDIRFYRETEDNAYYLCNASPEKLNLVEQRIERYLNATDPAYGYSLDNFLTPGTINPNGKERLAVYVVNRYKHGDKGTRSLLQKQGKKQITIERYEKVAAQAEKQLTPVLWSFEPEEDGAVPIMLAFQNTGQKSYLNALTEIMESIPGVECSRKFVERYGATRINNQGGNGLTIYSLYVRPNEPQDVEELLNKASLLSIIPATKLNELFVARKMTARQVFYAYTVMKFCFYFTEELQEEYELLKSHLSNDPTNLARLVRLHTKQSSETLTEDRIITCIKQHLPLMHQIFVDFAKIAGGEKEPEFNKSIHDRIRREVANPLDVIILNSFLKFNAHLLKTNFYKFDKAAIAYRLDPNFLKGTKYPEVPYGLFLVIGNDFTGFHIRFNDVARGGIRVIRSASDHAYRLNQAGLFTEGYGLAYTQQKKNKDIPEGGSKGTILLSKDSQDNTDIAFQKYVDSLLDLLLIDDSTTDVTDHYKKEELLFLGPDENTANLMDWAAYHAKSRGYKFWKAFTTGKSTNLGGIPHDVYGMTTASVHEYAIGIMRRLGLDESTVTKLQTGGPDGDLGSNEVLISNDKTIAIVDGSGVLYDPQGLQRDELNRLAKERKMVQHFDSSQLSEEGFLVLVSDRDKHLPSGEVVENGTNFRNNFHLHPLASADLFIPCGGRPESVNISNVHKLLDAGKPRWKYVVEGANLFITQEAREILEKHGVILYKDASANKGGVTSSSLEVLAALSFSNEEFANTMQIKGDVVPEFYKAYVEDVLKKIRHNARSEFECIWDEHEHSNTPRCQLTNILSDKINRLNDDIKKSSIWEDKEIVRRVLKEALPQGLLDELGLETIIERVPDAYLKAIFGAHLSSTYIYRYGLSASEFDLYEFLTSFSKDK